MALSRLTTTSASWLQAILLPQLPPVAGTTGVHYHAQLTFFSILFVNLMKTPEKAFTAYLTQCLALKRHVFVE